jgi:hypothetical protein
LRQRRAEDRKVGTLQDGLKLETRSVNHPGSHGLGDRFLTPNQPGDFGSEPSAAQSHAKGAAEKSNTKNGHLPPAHARD